MKQQRSPSLYAAAITTSCSRCYLRAHHHLQYAETAIHRVRGREVQPAERREVWHRHVPTQKKNRKKYDHCKKKDKTVENLRHWLET
jgi:hypothetical protein